jgi:glutathione synthase
MKIGILVNDIPSEWADYTTTHLAMAATNLGHEVWYMGVGDLALDTDDKCYARARRVANKQYRSGSTYLDALNGLQAHHQRIGLVELDVLLLRNDPANDVNTRPWARLVGINFGRLAASDGVMVLNDPNGLSHAVNKMYLQCFPEEVRPKALITRDRNEIKDFIEAHSGWGILKPLAGSGGRNVFLLRPDEGPNLNQMIDAVATEGYIIAEEYLPEARHGDTRMFLMNGKPLTVKGHYASFRRVRRAGDSDMRSNMTAGAVAEKAIVTEQMLQLAELVRPKLVEDGMFLVGLDIVGDKLLEINVFSPGGLAGLEKLEGVNFSREVIHAVENKVEQRRKDSV